jgi:hypothetical protein
MKLIHYALAASIIAIIIMIFLWPSGGPSKEQIERELTYKRQRAIDSTNLAQSQAQMNVLISEAKEARKEDSVQLKAKDDEIQRLKVKAAKAVAAIPQKAHDDYPQIQEALKAKDSVIQELDSANQYLRAANFRVNKEFDDLQIQAIDERRIAAKMLQDCEANRESLKNDLEKATKKEVRKVKFWKAAAVVLGVGGFLAGSQL